MVPYSSKSLAVKYILSYVSAIITVYDIAYYMKKGYTMGSHPPRHIMVHVFSKRNNQ